MAITEVTQTYKFDLKAFPNPTNSEFTIQLTNSERFGKLIVRVMDLSGRIIEIKNSVQPNTNFKLGASYRPGIYIIEIQQGDQRKMLKVIKQGD